MSTRRRHISSQLDHELDGLRQQLLAMGSLVDRQAMAASEAFARRDRQHAGLVIAGDDAVNELERSIDERCISVLALWQPEASDLRFVAAALKIVTDLERIGDLAVSTAELVRGLPAGSTQRASEDLPRLVSVALDMLREALQSFVDADAERAARVIVREAEVEQGMERLVAELKAAMCRDVGLVPDGLVEISVAKHVERLAAHASNIAEMVIYVARGEDVRHAR